MHNVETLNARQVLAKMQKGERLYGLGFTQSRGVFEDGSKVSHAVMLNLLRAGKISRPEGMSISSPYTIG